MQIEIDDKTAKNLLKIEDRYFFGLFALIAKNEDEEIEFREALASLAKALQA